MVFYAFSILVERGFGDDNCFVAMDVDAWLGWLVSQFNALQGPPVGVVVGGGVGGDAKR